MADLKQFNQESIADFVFHFCATCLKIADLSEAEKLDRFVRALVPDIRLQVELRGPRDFHEATMFAERANVVISRILGQDSRKNWQQKQYKSPPPQCPAPPRKTNAESSGTRNTGPEPMELSTTHRHTLNKEEY